MWVKTKRETIRRELREYEARKASFESGLEAMQLNNRNDPKDVKLHQETI